MTAEIIESKDDVRYAHNDEVSCDDVFELFPDVATDEKLDQQHDALNDPNQSGADRGRNNDPAHVGGP